MDSGFLIWVISFLIFFSILKLNQYFFGFESAVILALVIIISYIIEGINSINEVK